MTLRSALRRLLPVVLILASGACVSYQPVSQLAPPSGPDPETLAGEFSVLNVLGVDDSQGWPEAGERAALVSCAASFRPDEDADMGTLSFVVGAQNVSKSDLEEIVGAFCPAFIAAVYEHVPLDWLPESRIADDVAPRSDNADLEVAVAHEGYAYFGSAGGGVFPTLKGGMRDLGNDLGAYVFMGGINVQVADGGVLRFTGADVMVQGYDPEASRMRGLPDLQISGSGHWTLDDLDSEGLAVLGEALALRLAHVIETRSMDWPDDG